MPSHEKTGGRQPERRTDRRRRPLLNGSKQGLAHAGIPGAFRVARWGRSSRGNEQGYRPLIREAQRKAGSRW